MMVWWSFEKGKYCCSWDEDFTAGAEICEISQKATPCQLISAMDTVVWYVRVHVRVQNLKWISHFSRCHSFFDMCQKLRR